MRKPALCKCKNKCLTSIWAKNIWIYIMAIPIPKSENRATHILSILKRGFIICLVAQKKGAIRHAHLNYVIIIIYRELFILQVTPPLPPSLTSNLKVAHTRFGKLTWESAQAWNSIILRLLIAWGMTDIFMVLLSFYSIPLLFMTSCMISIPHFRVPSYNHF